MIQLLQSIIKTLNNIEVRGAANMQQMLGVIEALNQMIAVQAEQQRQEAEKKDG